jgi:hypothetical protein
MQLFIGNMQIIDPNSVFMEGGEQITPRHENYIIYANLEVKRKTRSILTSDGTSDSISTMNISFLNYEKSMDKKRPGETTTNWTNEFIGKDKVNDETFGMTDINIKFDKNNIPLVTIELIDVRGLSLIGQGENSPYSALFHLPYPEFTLTVKGYYGNAVQYKLSLLDFSSRFNSQTGNFEITCQFIGFTYAKLTDIPAAYILFAKKINGDNPKNDDLPYLWDFIKQVGELNIQIETIESESQDVKDIQNLDSILERVKNFINDYESEKNNSEFYSKEQYIKGGIFWEDLKKLGNFGIKFSYNEKQFWNRENFSLQKKQYNNIDNIPPYAFWRDSNIGYPKQGSPNEKYFSDTLRSSFTPDGETSFETFKGLQQEKVRVSFNQLIDKIEKKITELRDRVKEEINNKTVSILGEKPTIKRVFDIILSDTEIFLKKIRDVAIDAQNQNTQRLRLFPVQDSDLNSNNIVYPFPAYYEKQGDGEYIHTYMGKNSSINSNREFFPELQFVEDYLKFQQTLNELNEQTPTIRPESGWFPINPLESVYYYDSPQDRPLSPYSDIISETELLDKIIDRFIVILASYRFPDIKIYQSLAKIELNNLLLSFTEESTQFKTILSGLKNNLITKIKDRIKTRINLSTNDKKLIIEQVTTPITSSLVKKDTSIPLLRTSNVVTTLDNNISVKIFDFENNVASNNINNDELIKQLNEYYSSIPSWALNDTLLIGWVTKKFVSENFIKDDKSNLIRIKLDYDNFVGEGKIFRKSLLYDLNPEKLTEQNNLIYNYFFISYQLLGISTNFDDNVNLFEKIISFKNTNKELSSFLFLNYLYKINFDEISNFLKSITGVIEIPYFTILQIGSVLWDNDNNQQQGKTEILNFESSKPDVRSYEIEYYDKIVETFQDWNTKQVFIDEFLNFIDNNIEIITEIETTKDKKTINLNKDTPIFNNFINKNKILINPSYRIWDKKTIDRIGFYRSNDDLYQTILGKFENNEFIFSNPIGSTENDINEKFFQTFATELKKHIDEVEKSKESNKKSLRDTLKGFEDFKLETYNSFKSLYDRWIAGNTEEIKLREDFVYINRFYKDIGDLLVVNPQSLVNVKDNPKITLYSILSNILTDNRMDFHPLPGFITNMGANAEKVFGQSLTIDKNTVTKSKFVCMYVGGTSKQLNQINGYFKSDTADESPKDFPDVSTKLGNGFDTPFAFKVEYGSQTQSHFREIQLDQKEFKVTNESLRIEDEIAQSANTRRGIVLGQSLYSVYLQRSYSCRVSGLGNAMIQPLMYFNLPTIPLFKGYYLIINVEHSIRPNFMETSFTGVRISLGTVPIVTTYSEALGLSSSNTSSDIITSEDDGWKKQLNSLV